MHLKVKKPKKGKKNTFIVLNIKCHIFLYKNYFSIIITKKRLLPSNSNPNNK
jgi:hypothetical protein